MSINVLTGESRGWRYYTVIDVEPVRVDRLFCRCATLRSDDGNEIRPHVQDVFLLFEAVGNVVQIFGADQPAHHAARVAEMIEADNG
jgi:hypothetical protein